MPSHYEGDARRTGLLCRYTNKIKNPRRKLQEAFDEARDMAAVADMVAAQSDANMSPDRAYIKNVDIMRHRAIFDSSFDFYEDARILYRGK